MTKQQEAWYEALKELYKKHGNIDEYGFSMTKRFFNPNTILAIEYERGNTISRIIKIDTKNQSRQHDLIFDTDNDTVLYLENTSSKSTMLEFKDADERWEFIKCYINLFDSRVYAAYDRDFRSNKYTIAPGTREYKTHEIKEALSA